MIVLCATSGGVCIISSASVVGAPVGIAGAIFTLILSFATGRTKKVLSTTRNKKKHDRILMMAKSKLNSIENLISQALKENTRKWKKVLKVLWKMNKKKLLEWITYIRMYKIGAKFVFYRFFSCIIDSLRN